MEGNTTKALADLNYIIRRNPRHVNALQSHANVLYQKVTLVIQFLLYGYNLQNGIFQLG